MGYELNRTYYDRVVSKEEYKRYKEGDETTGIHKIWNSIVNQLPEKFKNEAIEKGFILEEKEDRELDLIYLTIAVPKAGVGLKELILRNRPQIICE